MATLDSLEPQRRAILELLLRHGKGYDDLGGMLDMPGDRVRELAREALVSLEPGSARRVDEYWRDRVADYVLCQQDGPEARATRGHLKRSEAARTWVSSLVDSLDDLYGAGARPDVPKPDGGRTTRPSGRGGSRVAAGAAGSAPTAGRPRGRAAPVGADPQQTEAEESTVARERPPARRSPAAPARSQATAAPPRATAPGPEREDRARILSPSEGAAVARRRQLVGAGLAAAVVAALVLVIALTGGGEEQDKAQSPPAAVQGAGPAAAQTRLVGQGRLGSVGKSNAQGVAVIAERGGDTQLLVQARGLEPSGRQAAYEVWLYNSRRDAVSLGGQVTDQAGSLQGAGPLPPEFRTYRFIDISREKIDRSAEHSGESVLRVAVADVLRGATAAGAPGAPAAPGGGASP